MRIIGGDFRGRRLVAPKGDRTRPTADRVRQALFDMLVHAPWAKGDAEAGAAVDARVLDAFAGSGALGLEALSRGAAEVLFFETDAQARRALAANIAACGVDERARILAADATHPPPPTPRDTPCTLLLLDPPYTEEGLAGRAVAALGRAGWIAPGALIVLETGARTGPPPLERNGIAPALGTLLAERRHGVARLLFFRAARRDEF
ncbi:MAG TPA: 16S rRNA (guanine(966)-N(2))-methyltransferase RsmD [Acetobacteraceae bacterium]|nr:16S rRNA (guanine(966)-N(2))-methyltransferase RsmD [Acetobacteraceae bacterium]